VIGFPVLVSSVEAVAKIILEESKLKISGKFICVANVHMLVTAKTNAFLSDAISSAWLVVSDGMPLVWTLKFYRHNAFRVAGPDLLLSLCTLSQERGSSLYFYGGTVDTIEKMERMLLKQYPGLSVAGIESPPILPDEPLLDMDLVQRVNDSGANILFVGLGCPKQELWMKKHAEYISAVQIGVGAAFDFLAGSKSRSPIWMQKIGLEWLFRLLSEPSRLWKRYLVTNCKFVWYWFLAFLKEH